MPARSDLRFTFTVGATEFEVVSFTLDEGLSETDRLTLELASRDPAIDFGQALDQPAHFTIWQGQRSARHVWGLVSVFEQGDTGFRRTRYRAVVEPRLARLGLTSDWRISQQRSVPQILQALLAEHGITHYRKWKVTYLVRLHAAEVPKETASQRPFNGHGASAANSGNYPKEQGIRWN